MESACLWGISCSDISSAHQVRVSLPSRPAIFQSLNAPSQHKPPYHHSWNRVRPCLVSHVSPAPLPRCCCCGWPGADSSPSTLLAAMNLHTFILAPVPISDDILSSWRLWSSETKSFLKPPSTATKRHSQSAMKRSESSNRLCLHTRHPNNGLQIREVRR